MFQLPFIGQLLRVNGRQLCRTRALFPALLVLCLCLSMLVSPAAELVFSQGVDFSGITMAVTAPAGDPVPELLEELMSGMEDVGQYCRFKAMDAASARAGLADGSVTAILALPEGFIQGILNGTNPDVELIVPADRPLESMLTLWVGQSAADLLAAFQSGIYGVLDLYLQDPPAGLSYEQVVSQINLRYISWTLNRQDLFRVQEISVTGQLPIGLHYGLSLLCFLILALAPFFYGIFDKVFLISQRRLLALGRTPASCGAAAILTVWLFVLVIVLPGTVLITGGKILPSVVVSALVSILCTAWISICCLCTGSVSGCGILSSLLSLCSLALSGGILPPVMLPQGLRKMMALSPVTWMRQLLATPAGYESRQAWLILLICTVTLFPICLLLYRSRFIREVDR